MDENPLDHMDDERHARALEFFRDILWDEAFAVIYNLSLIAVLVFVDAPWSEGWGVQVALTAVCGVLGWNLASHARRIVGVYHVLREKG